MLWHGEWFGMYSRLLMKSRNVIPDTKNQQGWESGELIRVILDNKKEKTYTSSLTNCMSCLERFNAVNLKFHQMKVSSHLIMLISIWSVVLLPFEGLNFVNFEFCQTKTLAPLNVDFYLKYRDVVWSLTIKNVNVDNILITQNHYKTCNVHNSTASSNCLKKNLCYVPCLNKYPHQNSAFHIILKQSL